VTTSTPSEKKILPVSPVSTKDPEHVRSASVTSVPANEREHAAAPPPENVVRVIIVLSVHCERVSFFLLRIYQLDF